MSDYILQPLRGKSPLRSKVESEEWYQGLDPGIRFAVRVLHASGIETGQSCEGGKGHCYDHPTVEFAADADDALGFEALSALQTYGLKVFAVSIRWDIFNGLPYCKLWRVEFVEPMTARADDNPNVVWGYQFQPDSETVKKSTRRRRSRSRRT